MTNHEIDLEFIPTAGRRYLQSRELRWCRLRKPLGFERGTERFDCEDDAMHLVAVSDDEVVGCVLFIAKDDKSGRLFQMVVAEDFAGKGIGRILVEHLEQRLHRDGFEHVVLHARCHVQGFYERLGYTACSDVYEEVGIPHITMERNIRDV